MAGIVSERPLPDPRPLRVLIVEDEMLIAMSLQLIVEQAGFDCIGTARNMAEAVVLCATTPPDIATMDINLDGPESGLDVAAHLYAEYGVTSLFMSAYSTLKDMALAETPGALGWITKPFTDTDIQDALTAAADLRADAA